MEIKESNLMFTLLSNMCKSTGGLYPANAACFQWCLKELRAPQAHCYSQFLLLCSPEYYWCILVVPNLRWLSTFMEILSSATL